MSVNYEDILNKPFPYKKSYKRKRGKRRSAYNAKNRHSSKFSLGNGLYLYFPPLTLEQESQRQREIVEHRRKNKENWRPKDYSREIRSANTKMQWATNKAYREKMEALNKMPGRTALAVIATSQSEKQKANARKNSYERTAMMNETKKMAEKLGLDISQYQIKKKDLIDLYYDLKQWL